MYENTLSFTLFTCSIHTLVNIQGKENCICLPLSLSLSRNLNSKSEQSYNLISLTLFFRWKIHQTHTLRWPSEVKRSCQQQKHPFHLLLFLSLSFPSIANWSTLNVTPPQALHSIHRVEMFLSLSLSLAQYYFYFLSFSLPVPVSHEPSTPSFSNILIVWYFFMCKQKWPAHLVTCVFIDWDHFNGERKIKIDRLTRAMHRSIFVPMCVCVCVCLCLNLPADSVFCLFFCPAALSPPLSHSLCRNNNNMTWTLLPLWISVGEVTLVT